MSRHGNPLEPGFDPDPPEIEHKRESMKAANRVPEPRELFGECPLCQEPITAEQGPVCTCAVASPTIRHHIHRILARGGRWKLPELRAELERELGRPVLDTTVSAKLRDLRKPQYGGHTIERAQVAPHTFVYWLG